MVEGVQQGPVLVGTFFMVAEEYLPPTAAPGTSGPHEPCPRTPLGADRGVCRVDAGPRSPRRGKVLRTESPCRTWARHGGPGLHV